MIGAIIGDIVGSVYEWDNIKTKDFPLFRDDCFFTDDTVMTVAVAEWIMNCRLKADGDEASYIDCEPADLADLLKKWGRRYPDSGYGGRFNFWLLSDDRVPYNSFGNGSAMRVSPCGWAIPLQQSIPSGVSGVRGIAKQSAEVTHNHPEGIKGAEAVALSIFYARHGKARQNVDEYKAYLKRDISEWFDYDLSLTLDEIRPTYIFNESCQYTVPEAITAFLESTGFEDAIRNAISLGGDSDTLAAITGSIAEAAYGVPDDMRDKALSYLDAPLREIVERWEKFLIGKK